MPEDIPAILVCAAKGLQAFYLPRVFYLISHVCTSGFSLDSVLSYTLHGRLSGESEFQTTGSFLTGKRDVESFIGHGEVREKADLGCIVSEQACAECQRQCGACQSPKRLREAAVLCHQQMVMGTFKVEGVEGELDACERA